MKFECKKICKKFGSNIALNEVDMEVKGGEIRALLGGNGSGKSTLSKIIGGALNVTAGTMELNDASYAPRSPIDAKRHGVVFTSQELSLFDNMSVEENIALCSYSVQKRLKTEKRKVIREVRELLDKYGIARLAQKPVTALAANEQYLVEFMKAVYQDADILIIDEITSALYEEDVKIVRQVMAEYKEQGKMVLFISHRMPEIMDLCDTVTVLRNGSVIATHRISDITDMQLVSEMTGLDIESAAPAPAAAAEDGGGQEILLSIQGMRLPQFDTNIDMEIRAGEVIGIAGLQGHGQASLVRSLFGLDPSAVPVVCLKGRQVELSSPAAAIRSGFSFISGDRGLEGVFEERSIAENLEIVSRMILNRRIDLKKVLSAFRVKYQGEGDLITSLSGGNQQKVVLARWLSNDPLVVLADDPTKGIDVQARRDVHKIMTGIAKQGSAVLMVSSDNDELVNLTRMAEHSRIVVMYEGQIIRTLTGSDITVENIARASVNL